MSLIPHLLLFADLTTHTHTLHVHTASLPADRPCVNVRVSVHTCTEQLSDKIPGGSTCLFPCLLASRLYINEGLGVARANVRAYVLTG